MSDSSSIAVRPNIGGGLTPQETVGRDQLVAELLELLTQRSVRIEDPRRMGKTTTLKLLASHGTEAAPIVYVTVQGLATPDAVVLDIARALYERLKPTEQLASAIRGFFDKATLDTGVVKFEASLDEVDAALKLEQILERLSKQFPQGQLVIAVDELPWAISNIAQGAGGNQGPAAAGAFLQSLQRFRDRFPEIRWIVAGSIGFHHVLRLAGQTNAVLTGLKPVSCGPLTNTDSRELVRRLFLGANTTASEEVCAAVSSASGGIPFIAHHLVELVARKQTVTVDSAAEAFDEFVADRERSSELTHLLQRLDFYMTKEQAAVAEAVLDACATGGARDFPALVEIADVDRDSALEIVNWLVDDHYLIETPTGFSWRFDVLRKVWRARRRQ